MMSMMIRLTKKRFIFPYTKFRNPPLVRVIIIEYSELSVRNKTYLSIFIRNASRAFVFCIFDISLIVTSCTHFLYRNSSIHLNSLPISFSTGHFISRCMTIFVSNSTFIFLAESLPLWLWLSTLGWPLIANCRNTLLENASWHREEILVQCC